MSLDDGVGCFRGMSCGLANWSLKHIEGRSEVVGRLGAVGCVCVCVCEMLDSVVVSVEFASVEEAGFWGESMVFGMEGKWCIVVHV